jgi:molybdate transport system substrate-binding protein
MKNSLLTAGALGLALALAPLASLHAAELKVLAGGSMTIPLKELGPQFERATGHKVEFVFAGTPELIKLATSAPFDAAVVPVDVFQNAEAKAKFVAEPTIDIARVGFGVAVKAGAPKPDISTPEKFKQVLRNAQSITFLPASAAGAYILKVFDRLGIGEEMRAKTKPQTATAAIGQSVANGDAEFGMFLANVLIAPGVELVGPFPGDLQNDLVFTSAVAADSKQGQAAKAFIDFLRTPEATAVIEAKGMKAG